LSPSEQDLYKVSAIDLPRARRLAFGVVLGQVGVTVLVSVAAGLLAGRTAALSALLGGGIASTASLAMASVGFTTPRAGAQRVLSAFYLGEAVKLTLVVVLFAVVLKWLKVVPLAMFGAFAATFLVYWIALLSALPAVSGARRGA
jgi:ATP synthase protein I